MIDFFRTLFQYQHQSMQALGDYLLAQNRDIPTPVVELYSHIVLAQTIWLKRIFGGDTTFPWDTMPIEQAKQLDLDNSVLVDRVLGVGDLETSLSYQNTKGMTFENTIRDILFHIINHTTHHRAQIMTHLRQAGIEPLATDYIFYVRDKS